MGFFLGYLIFVVLFAAGNGWEAVFDPSSLFGFVHILFWVTISGAVLLCCKKPTEESRKREEEIQEEGRRLKERCHTTRGCRDFLAWYEWCRRYNGGRLN